MRGSPEILRDHSGGLNNNLDPFGLPANQAADLMDVEPNGHSGLHRREGSVRHLASPAGDMTLLFYSQLRSQIVMTSAAVAYVGSIASGAIGSTPQGAIEAPVSGGQGPLYFISLGGSPFQWDGTTAGGGGAWTASAGAIPSGSAIAYHGNRVLVAGVASNPSRVYASGLQDPRQWGTGVNQGWQVDLDPNDGQGITGICPCGPYLLVMKVDKLYLIYDLDTGANRPLSRNVGGRNAVSASGGAYVVGGDGVYLTDGNSIRLVSEALSPDIFTQRIRVSKGLSFANVSYFPAYINGFLLLVPTLTSGPQDNYHNNERLGSWWKLQLGSGTKNVNRAVGVPSVGNAAQQTFLFAANGTSPQIDKWAPHHEPYVPVNATDGIGGTTRALLIDPFWKGATMDMGTDTRKRIRQMDVEYETDALAAAGPTLSLTRDDGTSATKALSGPKTTVTTGRLLTPGVSKRWTPKISGSDLWATHSLALRLQARKA